MAQVKILDIGDGEIRSFLNRELDRRIAKNSSYSMRAFAKALEMDSSSLNKLLSGKRKFSPKIAHNILDKVQTDSKTKKRILSKFQATDHEESFKQIQLESFEVIANWLHYAILELMSTNDFKQDTLWIAQKLNCSESEIKKSIQRLINTNLLSIDESGTWILVDEGSTSHVLDLNQTTKAHKQYQLDLLEQASEAVINIDISEREQSSMMFTSNPHKLKQAKKMIQDFRRELAKFMEDTDEKTTVYHMSTSLFPISNKEIL